MVRHLWQFGLRSRFVRSLCTRASANRFAFGQFLAQSRVIAVRRTALVSTAVAVALVSIPSVEADWIGYKGQRVSSRYEWGWPITDSNVVFKTYAEALQWVREEATQRIGGYLTYRYTSNNLGYFFSLDKGAFRYDYYSHDFKRTGEFFVGDPTGYGEARCRPLDWQPYCMDHSASNERGHFVYIKPGEFAAVPADIARANFGACSETIDPCNIPGVAELRGNSSFPVVAVFEVNVWDPSPKALACTGADRGTLYGNPCDAATGNKFQTETDFSGSSLSFTRYYNSLYSGPSPAGVGRGWSHNFSARIEWRETRPARATVVRPDGRALFFAGNGTDWIGDRDVADQLQRTSDGWVYTTVDGALETYDTQGRLVSMQDGRGQGYTLGYDAAGRLKSVTHRFGHTLAFTYSSAGRLDTVTDPNGMAYKYSYDAIGNLTQVTYPDGAARRYHYENGTFRGHLTGITVVNKSGATTRFATYGYEIYGRASSTVYAGGLNKYTLNYGATVTDVYDAVNTRETLTFAYNLGMKNLVSRKNYSDNKTLYQTFDANNNLTCRQDDTGRVTTWTYNTANQKISETSGRTGTCTSPVTTSATRTTTYAYLASHLDLPTVIESPSVAGGTHKKRTEIGYDATLKLPRTITQKGYTTAGTAVSRVVTLDYNASGQVKLIDGPRTDVADVTTLDYYECTTGGECGQLKRVTNALGHKTTYDVYDAAGRLLEMTDPNGLKTFYSYDPRGQLWSVTQQAAGGESRMTAYTYDAAGNVTEVKTPDGLVLTYTYDAANYLRTVTDNLGNKVQYGYDLKGNRTATKTYDPAGTLVRSLELAHDARNRVSVINSGGSITKQWWDAIGNLVKVMDPNTVATNGTAATVNEYDALNRLFKTTDRLAGVTQYGYDTGDRVKQVKAPNQAATGYVVDDLGNVLTETSPDRGGLAYGYDDAGNVTSLADARGITVSYAYDALNRLTQVDVPGTAEDATYTYDSALGCTNGIGRLCTATDAAGTSAYAHDAFGNLATHTRTELGVAYTTGYGYDALNRVAGITYPDGRKVDYTRNTLGQVTEVTLTQGAATQSLASQLTYRADGLLASLTTGNGVAESRLYTLAGRLETWTVGSETRTFLYDANGNLKERTGATIASFTYDALDRLKEESLSGFAQSFTFDANGNRKSDALGSYDYLAQSNRLTTTPTGAITLDAAGNLTQQGARTFGYTGSGQLKDITEGTLLAAYAYNGERQRTQKTVNNDTTVYHYDLAGNLLMETDATGTPKRAYVWVNGRPLAILEDNNIVYLHTDHLDTPRLATNAQGTTVWRWEGEAFGDTAASEDPDGDGSATTVNLRFAGQYYDSETGLHYNWNRYYDPRIGRYLSPDRVSIAQHVKRWSKGFGKRSQLPLEIDPFAYVVNNPLRWTDPTGLMGYGSGKGPFPKPQPSNVNVFGCLFGCVTTQIDGTGPTEPQASIEASIGAGIEICEADPEPKTCPVPKPEGGCGIYDPNCDNVTNYPDVPVPSKLGFVVGASVNKGGKICIQLGLFGGLPLPRLELGDLSE